MELEISPPKPQRIKTKLFLRQTSRISVSVRFMVMWSIVRFERGQSYGKVFHSKLDDACSVFSPLSHWKCNPIILSYLHWCLQFLKNSNGKYLHEKYSLNFQRLGPLTRRSRRICLPLLIRSRKEGCIIAIGVDLIYPPHKVSIIAMSCDNSAEEYGYVGGLWVSSFPQCLHCHCLCDNVERLWLIFLTVCDIAIYLWQCGEI